MVAGVLGEDADSDEEVLGQALQTKKLEELKSQALERFGRIDVLVVTAAPSAQTLDPARGSDPAQVAEAPVDPLEAPGTVTSRGP